jgi:murein DD-endopeptidase MepM/ murein hydrolase activator NlpD
MAISTQKLLPPSKSVGGSLAKVDKLSIASQKLINVDKLIKNNLIIQKKKVTVENKVVENKKREKREEKLERKKEVDKFQFKAPSLPKTGFLDSIKNFISYTLLGYVMSRYYEWLPKLIEFSKILIPALTNLDKITKGLLDGVSSFISAGYKANEEVRKFAKSVGGEKTKKTYDEFTKNFNNLVNRILTLGLYQPEPTPKKQHGGVVKKMQTGGNVTRAGRVQTGPTRQIKAVKIKTPPKIRPQQTQPGKDVGGKKSIQKIFPDPLDSKTPDTKAVNPLRLLRNTSKNLKQIPFIGGVMGAAVDLAMGQKPDKNFYRSFGNSLGMLIQNSIDNQTNLTMGDISKSIMAMADGGSITRGITKKQTTGEEIGMQIAKMFEYGFQSRINQIFKDIMREMSGTSMKADEGEGLTPGGGFGAGGYAEGSQNFVSSKQIYDYLKSKGLSHNHIMGILANIQAESSFNAGAIGDNGTSGGLFQHHATRFEGMRNFAGKNWAKNWRGQIDYALREESGKQYANKTFRTPEEASAWFTLNFERPANAVQKARERLENLKNFGSDGAWKGQYVPPGKVSPTITGRFGEMRKTGRHGGTDLAAPLGTPLRAISDGTVIESDYESGWGNYLVFKDNRGIYHLYGHMQGRVKTGKVKKGDIIGRVGMSGRTSGPHLHWEAGTGWNGTIQNKFDPLNRYSINAPFSTSREDKKTRTLPNRIPPGKTEEYLKNARLISSTSKPKSTEAIAMNASYEETTHMVGVFQKVYVLPTA